MPTYSNYPRTIYGGTPPPSKQKRKSFRKPIVVLVVILFGIIGLNSMGVSHAISSGSQIYSGIAGYCLDDYHDSTKPSSQVDVWGCNNSKAHWK